MGRAAYQDPAAREGLSRAPHPLPIPQARGSPETTPPRPRPLSRFFSTPPRRPWYRADPGYVAIHPGDILAGYRVTRLLGRGGMGEVWAAVNDHPDDDPTRPAGGPRAPLEVAIKVLLARAAMKPDLVRRFEREARIASAIKSPYVCHLIEVGETDEGSHILIFEQLTGETLADRLKREQY